jgi:hypothetical protein
MSNPQDSTPRTGAFAQGKTPTLEDLHRDDDIRALISDPDSGFARAVEQAETDKENLHEVQDGFMASLTSFLASHPSQGAQKLLLMINEQGIAAINQIMAVLGRGPL